LSVLHSENLGIFQIGLGLFFQKSSRFIIHNHSIIRHCINRATYLLVNRQCFWLVSGRCRFRSGPGHWLSLPRCLVTLLSPFNKCRHSRVILKSQPFLSTSLPVQTLDSV
jgi:hypothetical protein